MERKSIPRADNLCLARAITYMIDEKEKNTLDDLLQEINKRELHPSSSRRWTKSNLREHVSALVFLKLASRTHGRIYLTSEGKHLQKMTRELKTYNSGSLEESERRFFEKILFCNSRFLGFLRMFTEGMPISSPEQFALHGREISLAKEEAEKKATKMFGYFDKREFSDSGVFVNWALSIEIIGIDNKKKLYFPTFEHAVLDSLFLAILFESYERLKDERTLRSEIDDIRASVCKKLKITRSYFDQRLLLLNTKAPHIVSLERAPLVEFGSSKYGLISRKGETYYYLRLRGTSNDLSISS